MEIRYFRLVKTIAEEGNIVNSADKLFLTQSALSHQLRELEQSLGFKVFLRSRTGWTLTPEGDAFYQLASKVLDTIDNGIDQIQQIRDGSKGTVRLSMECYSFYQGIGRFLQSMNTLYPEINTELVLEATHQPIPKLLNKEIDIAIVSRRPEDENLSSIPVREDEVLALVHSDNQLAEKSYLEPKDFLDQNLIIHSYPLETVAVYEHFLSPNGAEPKSISAMPMTEVSLELVSTNFGIMCLPNWALSSFTISPEVKQKRLGEEGLKRVHYLVSRKEDVSKKYVSDFTMNFKDFFFSNGVSS